MNLYQIVIGLLSIVCGAPIVEQTQPVELLFAGDAMMHQAQLDKASEIAAGKGYDFSECYRMIAPEIQAADYAVVNLEVPLGGGPKYSGYPCFSAPDSYAEELKKAGFDLFLTANNHCLDRGDRGAKRTIAYLDSVEYDHIGTYQSEQQRRERVPFIKSVNGMRIGFLNYTYGTNGIEAREGTEVALIDRNQIADEIRRTRQAGAEIVCVAIHWGVEYVLIQNRNQEDLAKFLVDQGVDLIIGGHPHVVQPMKVVRNEKEGKDVLIVYSLGNFISNMKTADTRGGALLYVTLDRDENGKARFKKAAYETVYAAKPEGKGNYLVIPGWKTDSIPANQRQHFELFERGANKIFNQYNVGVERRYKRAK